MVVVMDSMLLLLLLGVYIFRAKCDIDCAQEKANVAHFAVALTKPVL